MFSNIFIACSLDLFLFFLFEIGFVEEIREENGERSINSKAEEEILVRLLHYLKIKRYNYKVQSN